jgi:uncharacterized protein (DUF1684 family)
VYRRHRAAALLVASLAFSGCVAAAAEDEESLVAHWRAARLEALTADGGWLTLVGLYWLHEGGNTLGRARSNAIAIDDPQLAARAGRFVLAGGHVRFDAARHSCVTAGAAPASRLELATDAGGEPTVLACGSLRMHVIERAGRFGVRVRDLAAPARRDFHGLEYFPTDGSWAYAARFEPYQPPHHVPIVNVLGMEIDMLSPGALVFERDGREFRLDALVESAGAEQLFVMFADGTSGHETYGGGRFLYTPLPEGNTVALDFNRAYNPPCAFTRYATCPLPPPQNRLELRVSAGELKYSGDAH